MKATIVKDPSGFPSGVEVTDDRGRKATISFDKDSGFIIEGRLTAAMREAFQLIYPFTEQRATLDSIINEGNLIVAQELMVNNDIEAIYDVPGGSVFYLMHIDADFETAAAALGGGTVEVAVGTAGGWVSLINFDTQMQQHIHTSQSLQVKFPAQSNFRVVSDNANSFLSVSLMGVEVVGT